MSGDGFMHERERSAASGLEVALEKLLNSARRHRAGLPRNLPAVSKQHEQRNRGDGETSRARGQSLRVDLRHEPAAGSQRRDFRDFRSDHLARPAPRRPEIHEHGQRCAADERLEDRIALQLDRFRGPRQFTTAFCAARLLFESRAIFVPPTPPVPPISVGAPHVLLPAALKRYIARKLSFVLGPSV